MATAVLALPVRDGLVGYSEARKWNTDIFRSADGTETRRTRHAGIIPFRGVGASYHTPLSHWRKHIQNHLTFGIAQTMYIPLWFSLTTLDSDASATVTLTCDTTFLEFTDGDKVLVLSATAMEFFEENTFEVRTIDSHDDTSITLTANVGSFVEGDIVVPLIDATPERTVSLSIENERVANGSYSFVELGSSASATLESIASYDSYAGKTVFTFTPESPITDGLNNEYALLGSAWSAREKLSPEPTERILGFTTIQVSKQERSELRAWFDNVKGRVTGFFVRSYSEDFKLTLDYTSGGSSIRVSDCGEQKGLAGMTRHIYINDADAYTEITGLTPVPTDEVALGISPTVGQDLDVGDIAENLYYVRFAADSLVIESTGLFADGGQIVTRARLSFRELQMETP